MASTFTEAFESAPEFLAKATVRKFREMGGTRELWIWAFDDDVAERMPGGGHLKGVQQDQHNYASARQPDPPIPHGGQCSGVQEDHSICADVRDSHSPMPGGGQIGIAHEGHHCDADARQPLASAEGHSGDVRQGHGSVAPVALEPSAQEWADRMNQAAEASYFQVIKLRSKAWTFYRYKDLGKIRSINLRENMVINDVIDWGRTHRIPEERLVHLTLPQTEMKKIMRRADTAILAGAKLVTKQRHSAGQTHHGGGRKRKTDRRAG